MKKLYKNLISLLLLTVMMFTLASPVIAVTISSEDLTASDIVYEDTSKRETFSKHYLTGDGSYFAVAYAEQVNYLDGDEWVEVDNSLSNNILTGEKTTKNDKFKVKFANKANKDKLVSVQTDEFKVSWGLAVSEDGTAFNSLNKVKNSDITPEYDENETTYDVQDLGKAVSCVIYENAYGDYLDVRYSVAHQKVKEDIILKETSAFTSYKVTYDIGNKGIYATLQDNGAVIFYNSNGTALFQATAPIMYDSANEVSADIEVTVRSDSKAVEITYTPSAEWLNDAERVYPIVLDPSYNTSNYQGNILDVSVFFGGRCNFSSTSLIMGMDSFTYIKFLNVPTVPSFMTVEGADIGFQGGSRVDNFYDPNDRRVYLAKIDEPWDEYHEVFQVDYYEYLETTSQVTYALENVYTEYSSSEFSMSIPIPNYYWGNNFNQYFDNYYGFYIFLGYCGIQLNFYSSEYAIDYLRPCLYIRYTADDNYQVNTGATYLLRNVKHCNYLTFRDQDHGSAYTSEKDNSKNQVVRFIYSTFNGYYQIVSAKTGHYLSFLYTLPSGDSYSVTSESSPSYDDGYQTGWFFKATAYDTIRICLATDPLYTLSGYYSSSNVTAEYHVENNTEQDWILEECYFAESTTTEIFVPFNSSEYNVFLGTAFGIQSYSTNKVSSIEIANNGTMTIHNYGSTTVTLTKTDGTTFSFVITVLLPNGTYFLENKQFEEYYMQIDDNASTPASGTFFELHEFDGDDDQRWIITHLSDGYYKIQSLASGKVITAPSTSGQKLTQSVYSDLNTQKWKIAFLDSGYVNISPKSYTTNNMAAAGLTIGFAAGRNIELETPNTNGLDEWRIVNINGKDVFLLGIIDNSTGHDHKTVFGSVISSACDLGYDSFNINITDYSSATDVANAMSNAKIFVFRGHGCRSNNNVSLSLSTDSSNFFPTICIYDFSTSTANIDLSDCEVMLFVGCETAYGTQSLVHAAVAAGAKYAIGFTEVIYCDEANSFTKHFFERYSQGYSVEESVNYAKSESGLQSCLMLSREES